MHVIYIIISIASKQSRPSLRTHCTNNMANLSRLSVAMTHARSYIKLTSHKNLDCVCMCSSNKLYYVLVRVVSFSCVGLLLLVGESIPWVNVHIY